tara:strand:- start:1278 stop:1802 length:525 start_codon:yes stop_codon:yes gene_type:complete
MNTYNIFAVPLSHGKLVLQPVLHKQVLSFVDNNYVEKKMRSCVKGFQFHKDFKGKKELNEEINKLLLRTHGCYIESGWLNILGNDSYNIPHHHTGNHIECSGVLYLSNDNNNINFTKDGELFVLEPKLFDILVFPYNLIHYVLPKKRNNKRICYAFNLVNVDTPTYEVNNDKNN